MKKTRSTKRALLLSALSLLLCLSMFVGSTFAWFTDSVTSSGNKIQSGKLELDLELLDKATNTWTSLRDNPQPLFNYTKWEPGYTEIKVLKVENEGTLALKWMAKFVSNQQLSILADVIDVYVRPSENEIAYPADRDLTGYTRVGTVAEFVNTIETTTKGTLEAGEKAYLGIALKMQETAGNQYQELDLGGFFDIQILATQYTYEKDSFDELYDQFADYDGEISTPAALIAAFTNGGTYKVLNDIALDETVTVPAGVSVKLDLGTSKITGANAKGAGSLVDNKGTLTIIGGTLENTTENGDAVINNSGDLTLGNTTINGAPIGTTGYPAYSIYTSGKLTVEEGTTISSDRGAIYLENGSDVVINGGNISVNDTLGTRVLTAHVIYAYGSNSTLTIKDGNFALNYAAAKNTGASVICPAGATITVNGGNFAYAGETGSQSGIFQNYMGYGAPVNVYGGTYNDTTVNKNVADGYTTIENADGTYTVVEGVAVANATELSNLLKSSATEINAVLADGEYTNVLTASNKTIHLRGSKNAIIRITDGLSTGNDHMGLTNCNVTLEGVTCTFAGAYPAYINNPTMTYVDCTLKGQFYLYGDTSFIGCTFDNDDEAAKTAMNYIYTYGNTNHINVLVDDCVFNTQGHSLIMFSDNGGAGDVTMTVRDSEFHGGNGRTAYAVANQNTAAIEIDGSCGADYTLKLEGNNTFDGGFSGLWRIKAMKDGVTTTVNGVVYTGDADDVYLDGVHYIKDTASRNVTLASN